MSTVPDDLLSRALALDEPARAELARQLLLSLGPDGPDRDPGWQEAWAEEIEARLRAVDEGRMALHTWEEVRQSRRNMSLRFPASEGR